MTQTVQSKRHLAHSVIEDILAILTGTLFVSLGIALFNQAGLLTGGTAGLAFLVHYRVFSDQLAVLLLGLETHGLAIHAQDFLRSRLGISVLGHTSEINPFS